MPETAEELLARIDALTLPEARGRLAARGLARGMIWRDGKLPQGSPDFGRTLSVDLLDYGYVLLSHVLRARELAIPHENLDHALVVAAEAIESAVRKGAVIDADRDFNLFVAASAFHLAQYAARSYCLLGADGQPRLNLSVAETCVTALLRGRRHTLRHLCAEWLENDANSDERVAARLVDAGDSFTLDDAERTALTASLLRALGTFDSALTHGEERLVAQARDGLSLVKQLSQERGYVPLWWTAELTFDLIETVWATSLHNVLPTRVDGRDAAEEDRWHTLRAQFVASLANRRGSEIQLWPSQIEAARRSIDMADDLVVALPTSAGKTRIAELCILRCLASGKRVIYVTPLRALSAQVERTLASAFVPLGFSVTALYGASGIANIDIGDLRSAQIVVTTPEKLDFAARQEPGVLDDIGLIVLDEGHMIGLGERELHYEVLVQRLLRRADAPQRRLVCLSAVFSEGEAFSDFTQWLRRDRAGAPILSNWRPTRQRVGVLRWADGRGRLRLIVDGERPFVPRFVQSEPPQKRRRNSFPQDDEEFVLASAKAFMADDQRVLIYCPLRRSVERLGEAFVRLNRQGYLPSYLVEGVDLTRALAVGTEWLGEQHIALRCLRLGVVVHHATMPRAFLSEVEQLLVERKVRLTISSPTLAQGIDLSSSVLIFRSIYRGRDAIPASEYANVVGRAGRAFVDLDGITVLPIFESGFAAQRKELAFAELRRQAVSRDMESGILLLISHLIRLMSDYTSSTTEDIAEYVLNYSGPWTLESLLDGREAPVVDPATSFDEVSQFETIIAELDIAILGSVDDASTAEGEIAEALDTSLRTSLWNRRLARLTPDDAALQRNILIGRAHWIWQNSSATDRRGFYAAGVGYSTGVAIRANIQALASQLLRAEEMLRNGQYELATAEIETFAAYVFNIRPFIPRSIPESWRSLLARWISGEDLPPVLGDPSEDIGFVQDGVVYRLVWAVEAVRAQGIAAGLAELQTLTGSVALTLTYGLPNTQSCILAQVGLRSRRMVKRLLEEFPAGFTDRAGFQQWMADLPQAESTALWQDLGDRAIWNDFSQRWAFASSGRWNNTVQTVGVRWKDAPPADGQQLRLLHNPETGRTGVYNLELDRIGTLDDAAPDVEQGNVEVRTTEDPARVIIRRFSAS